MTNSKGAPKFVLYGHNEIDSVFAERVLTYWEFLGEIREILIASKLISS